MLQKNSVRFPCIRFSHSFFFAEKDFFEKFDDVVEAFGPIDSNSLLASDPKIVNRLKRLELDTVLKEHFFAVSELVCYSSAIC